MISWDSSHDWEVQRYFHELTRVTIRFVQNVPSMNELLKVRQCLPQFRNTPPAELRASIHDGCLPLGELPTREARVVIERAEAAGLLVHAECASFISYLPFDRTTGCALLIENEIEAREVAKEMMAVGFPVKDIEIC